MAKIQPNLNLVEQTILVDPVAAEQQAKYQVEGLSYISNNDSIIPRDSAGNIILTEDATDNPLLIIDAVAERVTSASVLKVIDTRFQYYKFPVSIKPASNTDNVVIDFEFDNISARYILPADVDAQGQPSTLKRINTSYSSSWFTNGGELEKGFKRLPFSGANQSEIGSYQLTPDVIDTLKSNNKTLKFTIQSQFNSSVSSNTSITMKLSRSMPEVWRSTGVTYELNTETNNPATYGSNQYPYFHMEYVVDILNDVEPYDKYYIEVQSGNPAWALTENCFWKIDVIDIPTTVSLTGNVGHGVYSFGNNLELREISNATGTSTPIYKKDTYGNLIKIPAAAVNIVPVNNPAAAINSVGY